MIGEVKAMMATVNRRFAESWGLSPVELAAFSTDRFLLELDRLEEHCSRDFRSASSLLTRGRRALAALFFDTVALKVVHVFEIADREVRTWMNSFIRPLEAQVGAFQEQANSRIEGMARIRDAESGLVERIDDLQQVPATSATSARGSGRRTTRASRGSSTCEGAGGAPLR